MNSNIRSSRTTESYLDTIRNSSHRVNRLLSALNSQYAEQVVLSSNHKEKTQPEAGYLNFYSHSKPMKVDLNSSPEFEETPKPSLNRNARSLERLPKVHGSNRTDKSIQTNEKTNPSSYDSLSHTPAASLKIRVKKSREHLKPRNQFECMMDYYKNRVKLHFMPKKRLNGKPSKHNSSLENIKCADLFSQISQPLKFL